MERLWVGVICNCMYDNEEENGVIDNVEGVRDLYDIYITYGSENRSLLVDVWLKFERAEMQMIRWMCCISMKDRMTNEELRRLV